MRKARRPRVVAGKKRAQDGEIGDVTTAWLLTIAECAFGYWLTTIGWPVTGAFIIGSAVGFHVSRLSDMGR